ncbi:CDP-diacylglycerol--glycerol-3-phosphate 3-phosphatidyltransferase [Pelagicoccus sp. NFK12]|uniref:CDP-diacylglycerol--glycerol-3-phosphate 3-phosphatidyltransferase n=1 Tax=Pelagicoccus enzymogenes TaxID=2773457 RepID=A0A927FBS6_9BACT|nr:CDP-diacylglycerol--glycerol-3-phosphate 3-phosphatidyltransferase [Pelagicoccus enzymogenes]MBD5780543.1 CDP-diacylglycerol--glycerol-3-phosphate 3-phosphatidyltransferase [Pelagicoccus enzymogenes]MDQ8199058.1 CDP-diacylglycerol--glycerol-3-phosphate 3-phosphatidyltransferase [Pelagicoccus enzymogenes]
MNLPNILTLSRIPMMFLIVWLMRESFTGAATAAFVLFVVAGVTDWADGYAARKLGQVSNFGILMDALTDKILVLGIMVALVDKGPSAGGIQMFLFLLILCREFMITGLRLVAATKGVVMAAESAGKQKTVTQIIALGGFLLAMSFQVDCYRWGLPYASDIAYWIEWVGRVFFWICTVMTLYSGAKYFKKYGELVFKD